MLALSEQVQAALQPKVAANTETAPESLNRRGSPVAPGCLLRAELLRGQLLVYRIGFAPDFAHLLHERICLGLRNKKKKRDHGGKKIKNKYIAGGEEHIQRVQSVLFISEKSVLYIRAREKREVYTTGAVCNSKERSKMG